LARDKNSELAGPIVFEALEPRVLLSGDGLCSVAVSALIPETHLESPLQEVQYAELLESCDEQDVISVAEQATGEMLNTSDQLETNLYRPIFTIFTSDATPPKQQDAEASKAPDGGVKIAATEVVETTTENFDATNPASASADGSMPTCVNDGEISAEESASIEIRGPPADRTDSLTTSDSSTYATSDESAETSDGEVLQSINAPNLPGLVLVDADISSWEGQIIYLDFDGETDVTYNGPVVVEGIDIPAFSAESAGLAGEEREIIAQIVSALEQQFEGTGILFTATKPDSDTSHSTVFIGGDGSEFREYGFFVGLAEKIDVGDQDSSDKALVFSEEIVSSYTELGDLAINLAGLIAHESVHLLGYAHDQRGGETSILSEVGEAPGSITSIDRWTGYLGEEFTVKLTIDIQAEGDYLLDIDIEGIEFPWLPSFLEQDWDLTSDAYAKVDGLSTQYDFNFQGRVTLPDLTVGEHDVEIFHFKAPDAYAAEQVLFELHDPLLVWIQDPADLNTYGIYSPIDVLARVFVADTQGVDNSRIDGLSFKDGFGGALPINSIMDLLETFSPVVLFEDGENYNPISVDLILNDTDVEIENLFGVNYDIDLDSIGTIGDPNTYINLPGTSPSEYRVDGSPTLYASIVPDLDNDRMAINYWFYYAYSNWGEEGGYNNHESDWEGYTVYLEQNAEGFFVPTQIAVAQHEAIAVIKYFSDIADGGQIVDWSADYLENNTHPKLFVGLGGHATYLFSGETEYGLGITFTENHFGDGDSISFDSSRIEYINRAPELIGDSNEWGLFPGHWGEFDLNGNFIISPSIDLIIDGDDGPNGPVFQERWFDPWGWAENFDIAGTIGDYMNDIYEKIISNGVEWYVEEFGGKPVLGIGLGISGDDIIDLASLLGLATPPTAALTVISQFVKTAPFNNTFSLYFDIADILSNESVYFTNDGRDGWVTTWIDWGFTLFSLGLEVPVLSNVSFGIVPIEVDPAIGINDDPWTGVSGNLIEGQFGGIAHLIGPNFHIDGGETDLNWWDTDIDLFNASATIDLLNVTVNLGVFDVKESVLRAALGPVANTLLGDLFFEPLKILNQGIEDPIDDPNNEYTLAKHVILAALNGDWSWFLRPAVEGTDDHGDTFESATLIDIGGSESGMILSDGSSVDVDVFKFKASNIGYYEINVQTPDSDLDSILYLKDESGQIIACNDDSNGTFDPQMFASLQEGETYFIEVHGYNATEGGQYELSISLPSSKTFSVADFRARVLDKIEEEKEEWKEDLEDGFLVLSVDIEEVSQSFGDFNLNHVSGNSSQEVVDASLYGEVQYKATIRRIVISFGLHGISFDIVEDEEYRTFSDTITDREVITESLVNGVNLPEGINLTDIRTKSAIYGYDGGDTIYLASSSGASTIYGGPGADIIYGSTSRDVIWGGSEGDQIHGLGGDDEIYGEAGSDTIWGDGGIDTIRGGDDGDFIYGGSEGDYLYGEGGYNYIEGNGGSDHIYGGDDGNTIYGDDHSNLDAGMADFIWGGGGVDTIYGNGGDDEIYGGGSGDEIYGNAGNDEIFGEDGDDTIDGGAGHDIILGDSGTISTGIKGSSNPGTAKPTVSLERNTGDGEDIIKGGSENDWLYGGQKSDFIDGQAGDDRIFGNEGSDRKEYDGQQGLVGGSGNDIIFGDNAVITQLPSGGNKPLWTDGGGSGNDYIYGGDAKDWIFGQDGEDDIYGDGGDDVIEGNDDNDVIEGNADNDTIEGNNGNDIIFGNAGSDHIYGEQGNDILLGDDGAVNDTSATSSDSGSTDYIYGQEGEDKIFGGGGDDYLYGYEEDANDSGQQRDIIIGDGGRITYDSKFDFENVTKVEATSGSGGNDTIQGNEGDDIILAGAGDDEDVQGNSGNDIILGDNGTINLSSGVLSDISTKGQPADGADNLWGDVGNDIIIGGPDGDEIYGEDDSDILIGDNGAITGSTVESTVEGNDGVDNVYGQGGDDRIFGGGLGDNLYGDKNPDGTSTGSGRDILIGDGGAITYSGDKFTFNDVTNITNSGQSSGGADTIEGNEGNDIILGGAAGDTILKGNAGEDVILGDNGTIRLSGGKVVTINTANEAQGGADKIEGNEADDIIIGGTNGSSDEILGGEGDDLILGDNGILEFGSDGILDSVSSALDGIGGGDVISGDGGKDTIIGGTGGDTIYGNSASPAGDDEGDILIGDNGDIYLSGNVQGKLLILGSAVNLITTTDEEDSTGGADTIYGNIGDDVILGGMNSDNLYGNENDDLILGDNGKLDFAFGDSDLTTLDLVSSSRDNCGGGDVISGNAGKDTIIGGTGGDEIYGDAAIPNGADDADVLLGDNGDIYLSGNVPGKLLILDSAINLIKTTDEAESTGGADIIKGNAGDDIILGGVNGSSDTIYGNEGDDIILGDNGELNFAVDGNLTTLDLISSYTDNLGGKDIISGNAGKDAIIGGTGGDEIYGDDASASAGTQDGADIILGDNGEIILKGGIIAQVRTTDTEECTGGIDTIAGNYGNDIIFGGVNGDFIYGNEGNDIILGDNGLLRYDVDGETAVDLSTLDLVETQDTGLGWVDIIHGNAGDDVILGETNGDTLYGDQGNDVVLGDFGRITLVTGIFREVTVTDNTEGGVDIIYGGSEEDILAGGAFGDIIDGNAGDDLIFGDNAKLDRWTGYGDVTNPRFRVLTGTKIHDSDGNALVSSQAQPNPTHIPAWADWDITLLNHSTADETTALSNFGNDYIAGGAGDDMIFGQLGNDTIQGDGSIEGKLTDNPVEARRLSNGMLYVVPSLEALTDGDDYIEGGGGNDVIFGNLGQDDIIGGSSNLFSLITPEQRPDGSDLIFGGAGTDISRNNAGDTSNTGHARDADMILGDNGNIYRLVGMNGIYAGFYLTFGYDNYGPLHIVPRAADLLDYTIGGMDYNPVSAVNDIGAGDEIHGESGDDFIYGMKGNDVLFGEGQDDDLIGGYGNDWISGGTGEDGVIGDDGRIYTSRNGTAEPLYNIGDLAGQLDQFIYTPGKMQQATINISGQLKKTVNLTPFNVDPNTAAQDPLFDPQYADDIIYGGLGNDWLHGGPGDDALSGAEALASSYAQLYDNAGNLIGVVLSDYYHPYNPADGNVLRYNPDDPDARHYDRTRRAGEFALYDEYDPLRKILLANDGTLSKTGSGYEFLLNFSSAEGIVVGTSNGKTYYSDGNDAIFGDLGNDWLVGGTGCDNLYSGWGNDLLNADDSLTTNGGLNNSPDTHSSYEDRAYGGAGRDALIANTGGDRLIDWVGEFNSYLVPFAPYGMATISRTLQPQLSEFLYALSMSDGADPTRAADTGADPLRNGEPEGELGVVKQRDFAWHDQVGAPSDPQAGNIPGGKRDVLRSANFNDGKMQNFFADSGVWQVSNGALKVSASTTRGDAVAVFNVDAWLPSYYEILASVKIDKALAGWKSNAFIIFDYQSPTDFKFAGINLALNKIQMGHRTADGWIVDVQSNMQLKENQYYNFMLAVNGTVVTVTVNGTTYFSNVFASRIIDGISFDLNTGLVGVGCDMSKGAFDNITVQRLAPQTTYSSTEDFSDGSADLFTGFKSGLWQVSGGRYNAALQSPSDKAISIIDLAQVLEMAPGSLKLNQSSYLELEAIINTNLMGGLIYDYYGPEDFKYVVIKADTDQMIIGHHTSKGWFNDAVFSRVINVGTDYRVTVSLKGTTVSVWLNGQAVGGYVYNALVTDGYFGLLSVKGQSSFDTITVKTDDPVFQGTGSPLMGSASSRNDGGPENAVLSYDVLTSIVEEAISRWTKFFSLDSSVQSVLESVTFVIADLPGLMLGQASGNTILIDTTAAAYGWFVDPTPSNDAEFTGHPARAGLLAATASSAYGDMDLLSVVMHEMGHILGLNDLDSQQNSNNVMSSSLTTGVRSTLTATAASTLSRKAMRSLLLPSVLNPGWLKHGVDDENWFDRPFGLMNGSYTRRG